MGAIKDPSLLEEPNALEIPGTFARRIPGKNVYQFIRFDRKGVERGRLIWACNNKKQHEELGEVRWFNPWKQWCYFPTTPAVYSKSCMVDINHFIDQLMELEK